MLRAVACASVCAHTLAHTQAGSGDGVRLTGVFRTPGSITDCHLVQINPYDGSNYTVGAVQACAAASMSYPAYSAYDTSRNALIVAIASTPSIVAIDVNTAEEAVLAPMPAYNDSDMLLGLVHVSYGVQGATYLVSQNVIYSVADGQLNTVANVNPPLPANADVAVSAYGGAKNKGQLFVADEGSNKIYVFDLPAMTPSRVVTSGVKGPMDLQFANNTGMLIELASYQLYATNPATGSSKKLMDIPNGPGFPRVNGISPDGATFFFFDFSTVHLVDVATGNVTNQAPCTSSPYVMGFPQWTAF